MTLIIDEKGRKRHEKYSPIPQQVVCSECGIITSYSHAPLIADKKITNKVKTIKNRKTGEITAQVELIKYKKTGEYVCKNCK